MSGTQTVSAVIPTHNARDTIHEAVASVDRQSCRVSEIVLVDDASTDGTPELLRTEYGRRNDCRLILRTRNGGPAAARNAGVSAAKGDWIAFLDGDDAWLPHRLDVQLSLAAEHRDVDLWCGTTKPFEEERGASSRSTPGRQPPPPAADPAFRKIALEEFVEHNPVATSTVLVRRAVLENVGGFDEQFRGPEDFDLWLRVAAHHTVGMIKAPLSRYRVVPGSLSLDDRRFLPEVLRVLEKAFAGQGVLAASPDLKKTALSTQYWNASWMAFQRGARGTAARHWYRAMRLRLTAGKGWRPKSARLLVRYLFGRQQSG